MTDAAKQPADVRIIENLNKAKGQLLAELHKVIIGQDAVIELLMQAMLSRGHCLLVGVPGLAKTLMISMLAKVLRLKFNRIQFTPDLMPSDITGTDVIEEDLTTGRRAFRFVKGPVFANIILADEINRTPPKTQAALLQAMQEYHVTAGGNSYNLDLPFFVLATQNPIEQEGTYPLPEAQLDRFLFNILVKYPSHQEEVDIMRSVSGDDEPNLQTVLDGPAILQYQHLVRRICVADHIFEYAATLVRSTRPDEAEAPEFIRKFMAWGAGPRASLNLIVAGKARAALRGRSHVSVEDIQQLCLPILRHRIIPNFAARSEGMTSDTMITRLLEEVPSDEKLYKRQSA